MQQPFSNDGAVERGSNVLPPGHIRTLDAIHTYVERHGAGPTLRELAAALGLRAVSAAHRRVLALEALGLVTCERTPGKQQLAARTLRLSPRVAELRARSLRLRASRLLRGERELVLGPQAQAVAERLGVGALRLHVTSWGTLKILSFPDRAERDVWADLILDELDHK
jgi:hypothetical protein